MTNGMSAIRDLQKNGYIVIDKADKEFPNFKVLADAAGFTITPMEAAYPKIEQAFRNLGYEGEMYLTITSYNVNVITDFRYTKTELEEIILNRYGIDSL